MMNHKMNISTLVFFDIETTGLPQLEKNETKITELSFVAVSAKEVESTSLGSLPLVNKLSLLFNPQKKLTPKSEKLTGLSNYLLAQHPVFEAKIKTINSFLEELPKPVCLVAHNGNRFDFKVLTAEYNDANATIPMDLLCVDSLIGFRKVLKNQSVSDPSLGVNIIKPVCTSSPNSTVEEIMTDDDDEWPELNATVEDWKKIDEVILSLSNTSLSENNSKLQNGWSKRKRIQNEQTTKKNGVNKEKEKMGYSLSDLYRRLLKKEPVEAHRAEADCIMLLECVVATKSAFLPWVNSSVQLLTNIKPLERKNKICM